MTGTVCAVRFYECCVRGWLCWRAFMLAVSSQKKTGAYIRVICSCWELGILPFNPFVYAGFRIPIAD